MFTYEFFLSVIAPYLNFFIFLFLAYLLFRKPLKLFLMQQKDEYQKIANEAHIALEEARENERLLNIRISNLESSLKEISAKEKVDIENETYGVIKNAENLARHLREEAERISQAEIRRAKESLKEEIVELVKLKVAAKIETEIGEKAHRDLLAKDLDILNRTKMEI